MDLYNEPRVSKALVFRGGTALNKLFLRPAARYSEDIDFVQKNADPIGQTIDAIREILKQWLGDPKWKITQRGAKVLPLRSEEFNMQSDWWSGNAKIATYEINELMATKLRALYQRRKGRDLFDLWYVTKNKLINLDRVFENFLNHVCNFLWYYKTFFVIF